MISLKEYLKDLLPEYFVYKINLANTEILSNDLSVSKFIKSIEYDLGNKLILNITLATKESFLLSQYREIWLNQLFFFLSLLLVSFIIFAMYFEAKRKSTNLITKLKKDLLVHQEKFANIKKTLLIQSTINKNFIQKATEIYLEEAGGRPFIQLFPLSLVDKSNKKINLLELKTTIQNYFCGLYENISIYIINDVDFAYYHIGREVLHQVVISV